MSSLLNQKVEATWKYSVALMGVLLWPLQGQPEGPQGEPRPWCCPWGSCTWLGVQGAPWADLTAWRDSTGAKSTSQDKRIFSGSRNSLNTMFSFLMESLGRTLRGHSSHFLKHPKVGGLGISSWFLYLTGGASIAQSPCWGRGNSVGGESHSLEIWIPYSWRLPVSLGLFGVHSTCEGGWFHLQSPALHGYAHPCWAMGLLQSDPWVCPSDP